MSQMGRGAAVPPGVDLSEEAYRREVCTIAAGIVDQYCVGAPDDRGVTAVQVIGIAHSPPFGCVTWATCKCATTGRAACMGSLRGLQSPRALKVRRLRA